MSSISEKIEALIEWMKKYPKATIVPKVSEDVLRQYSKTDREYEQILEEYEKIKNSGLRIRRCILGEIKEKPDGGLYYTKQFRYMFNCIGDVGEFLRLFSDERMKGYAFFYRQLLSFYKSIKYLRRYSEKSVLPPSVI